MGADGALGRGLLGGEDVAAVEADPAGVHVADKELVVPQEPGEAVEAVGVDLLNLRDLAEVALNGREALLLGLLGEKGYASLYSSSSCSRASSRSLRGWSGRSTG